MKHNFRKLLMIIPAALLLLFVTNIATADQGLIIVDIEQIEADRAGNLIIALFDAEGSWPKHDSALGRQTVPVSGSEMQVRFESVVTGRPYAVQVLHDSNTNNKLDFRWFPYPKPKEGVGVSNNNRKIGPPSFEKALFRADTNQTTIAIQLSY